MHRLLIVIGILGFSLPVYGEEPNKPAEQALAILKQLETLEIQDTGYYSFSPMSHDKISMMLHIPPTPPQKSNAILSLVKLGIKVIPTLLDHLDDDRRTKIVFSKRFEGSFRIVHDEGEQVEDKPEKGNPAGNQKQYTLRVGDVCYLALGQIVNRNYAVARYTPANDISGKLAITSVPHYKKLRDNLKKEWSNLTPEKHQELLARDLNSKIVIGEEDPVDRVGASLLLIYYYPKAFESIAIAKVKQANQLNQEFLNTLHYFESKKLDEALLDFLSKTGDVDLSDTLVQRLAGRGYDAKIEAFIQRMLANSSDFNREEIESLRHKLGYTRLHVAVELRALNQIDAALKSKVDVNARSKDGRTALDIAVKQNNHAAVERLLSANADANLKDAEGRTAMERAALYHDNDMVQRLAKAQTEPLGFFSAVTIGKADRVKELVKAKPELLKQRTIPGNGLTPLAIATQGGHEEVVRVLLDAGADVNGPAGHLTPLHQAVNTYMRKPNLKLVKLLIDRKADVNRIEGYDKQTPLHYAVDKNNIELVKLLLEAKPDLTLKNSRGQTPLDMAKRLNQQALVKLLEAAKK